MNNKKNYKKGTRHNIIQLMHTSGLLTYRSIRLLPWNTQTVQRKITEMKKEGVISEKKTSLKNSQRFLCLDNYLQNKPEYEACLNAKDIEYYEAHYSRNLLQKIWYEKSARPIREILQSETLIMMYSANIPSLASQLPNNTCYISSRDLKRATEYSGDDIYYSSDSQKLFQYTKAMGLLVSDGGNYGIYNVHNRKSIEYITSGEYKFKIQMDRTIKSIKKTDESLNSGILFLSNMMNVIPYLTAEDNRQQKFYNLTGVYPSLYLLPYSDIGRDMLVIMTKPAWKYNLILDATGEVMNTSHVNYECDHYDNETQVGTLVFCVPNINKLKRFTDAAKLYGNKKLFRIICFDYQKEFVKYVSEGACSIYTTPFKDYFNKYKEN